MCGINVIVAPRAARFVEALDRMNARLAHRGPDGAGVVAFDDCLLGHRRLSIIDLEGGKQPMCDASGERCVTFNGEIYGFKEIIPCLSYPFRTKCDTELLLALYDQYGIGMMQHLPGMFAFAIWDDREKRLFAARDRLGEKPLYYARLPDQGLIISSEIKGILASGLVSASLDPAALSHYLMFGYSPRGRSIYREIDSLPPAHVLVWQDGSIRVERYWSPPPLREHVDEQEAIAEFKERLNRAVRRQLVADVEIAAFLSGGLDSSSIVRIASRHNPALRTISYGFEAPYSELHFAGEVARHCETCHVEVHDEQQDIPAIVRRMTDVYDEPFFDSSAVPTWLICRRAAEQVKVVLTGDGGDEIVGGYNFWYKPVIAMHERYPRRTAWLDVLFVAARIAQRCAATWPALDEFTRLYGLRRRCRTVPRAHWYQQRVFSPMDLARWGLPAVDLTEADRWPDNPNAMFRMDIEHYMPGDILVKTDRASMAHGLELRAPFLDVDVVEFCLSLPYSLVIKQMTDKFLLRSAMARELPPSLFTRHKQGFGAPLSEWLARCRDLLEDELFRPNLAIYDILHSLSPKTVRRMAERHQWSLLMLSLWLESRRA